MDHSLSSLQKWLWTSDSRYSLDFPKCSQRSIDKLPLCLWNSTPHTLSQLPPGIVWENSWGLYLIGHPTFKVPNVSEALLHTLEIAFHTPQCQPDSRGALVKYSRPHTQKFWFNVEHMRWSWEMSNSGRNPETIWLSTRTTAQVNTDLQPTQLTNWLQQAPTHMHRRCVLLHWILWPPLIQPQ